MTFLPIVDRELRAAARRPSTYWARLAFALAGAGVVSLALMFSAVARSPGAGLGRGLFSFLSMLALGFSGLAGVFLTADCLSEEKREGTLGLLFLTDLKGYDVVLGKLAARSLSAGYGVLALFPVLAATLTLGGVTAGEFWRMAIALVNTLFFSLSAGMFVSALSRNDQKAMASAAGLIFFVSCGLPLAAVFAAGLGLTGRPGLALASPLTAWQNAFDGSFRLRPADFGWSILLTQAWSWMFLMLAAVLLPRVWQGGRGTAGARGDTLSAAVVDPGASRRRPRVGTDPVCWLALRHSRLGWAATLVWLFFAMGFAMLSLSDASFSAGALQFAWPVLLLVLRILVGIQACRFFVEARRAGTLEVLLCTPLTVRDILRGQWHALRRLYLVPVVALAGAATVSLISVAATAPGPASLPVAWPVMIYLYSFPKLVCDLLAAGWVGMLMGLTSRRPNVAPGLTVLYTVVLPMAAFCVPDFLLTLPLFLWARDRLHRELRRLSGLHEAVPNAPRPGGGPPKLPPRIPP